MCFELESAPYRGSGHPGGQRGAEKLAVKAGAPKSVYEFIADAREAVVKSKVCTPTLGPWGESLTPQVEETVGGACVISQAMELSH